ncbi:MAG: peptidyl-prolyl cis-trans isomerase [Acidobacteria bacterium]|nr:peptidyl-prolyl cis-trans isomerase [Acidobacteriota bacterium]
MLNLFRTHLRHTKWILLLIVFSFLFFFGVDWWSNWDDRNQPGGMWVARVNGQYVPVEQWRNIARRMDEQYRQMLGGQYEQFRKNLNVEMAAARQAVQQMLVVQDARRLGLTVSDDELSAAIHNMPVFQRDGQFIGGQLYHQLIQRGAFQPYNSTQEFEAFLREQLLVEKWQGLIRSSVVVSEDEVREEYRRRHEKVNLEYVALPLEKYQSQSAPTAAEVGAWYESHKDRYRQGEGRRASYVLIDDRAVESKVQVSDDEIRAYYEQHQDLFTRPEERHARHVLIKVEPDADQATIDAAQAKAEQIAEKARSGADFAQLAQENSDDPGSKARGGDLGFFPRGRMVPEFDEAVFTLEKGKIAGPVRTSFGFHVIKLEDIQPGGVRPLEEVKEQIRGQLRFPRVREQAHQLAQQFHDAAVKGQFREAAASMKLEPKDTGIVTRTGSVPGLGPAPEMIETIFALDKGKVSDVLSVQRGEVVLVMEDVLPNYVPPLEAVRAKVEEDVKRDGARERAAADMRQALARSGNDLAAAARALGVELRTTTSAIARGQDIPGVGYDAEVEKAAFSARPGELAGPIGGATAVVALRVTGREEADLARMGDEAESVRESLRSARAQRLVQERIEALHSAAQPEYNPDLTRA